MALPARTPDQPAPPPAPGLDSWRLDQQVGFLLRRAQQRYLGIFAAHIPDLTPTQFAALVVIAQSGPISQNDLGRRAAMDAATIKGVVDRLAVRGLVERAPDGADRRRLSVQATGAGLDLITPHIANGAKITAETLAPLTEAERRAIVDLLIKLG